MFRLSFFIIKLTGTERDERNVGASESDDLVRTRATAKMGDRIFKEVRLHYYIIFTASEKPVGANESDGAHAGRKNARIPSVARPLSSSPDRRRRDASRRDVTSSHTHAPVGTGAGEEKCERWWEAKAARSLAAPPHHNTPLAPGPSPRGLPHGLEYI